MTTCYPSLAPGPYEDWRGYTSLAPGSYENWRGYTNGTIPIPSYWAHTGHILALGPLRTEGVAQLFVSGLLD